MRQITVGERQVGDGTPAYIVAEIGINHNGDIQLALEMMEAAKEAGVDAVKFQKRDPVICVPEEQKRVMRDTPWGRMTYLEYKERLEFCTRDYDRIEVRAWELGLDWFASVWDIPSLDFIQDYNVVALKIPSAALTDHDLIEEAVDSDLPIILSTGMSSMSQIKETVTLIGDHPLALLHCTSIYPCPNNKLNLKMIESLRHREALRKAPIGYSGHETGLATTVAAVAMGASIIERHFTMDRAMWGTDQAASVEPQGFRKLVKDIRAVEDGLGFAKKVVYPEEYRAAEKLRRFQ